MMIKTLLASLSLAAASDVVILSTFDENVGPVQEWKDTNDPVMGGASTSTFKIYPDENYASFNGTCAIVKFLNAPGFAKSETVQPADFPDASKMIGGSILIKARTMTPEYSGFKIGFGATGVPHGQFSAGSFKAGFALNGTDWQVVSVPFTDFSYDWSGYTGECDTKDPNGLQHYCCTAEHPEVCPTAEFLGAIVEVDVWAEGVEGDFHLDLQYIAASSA